MLHELSVALGLDECADTGGVLGELFEPGLLLSGEGLVLGVSGWQSERADDCDCQGQDHFSEHGESSFMPEGFIHLQTLLVNAYNQKTAVFQAVFLFRLQEVRSLLSEKYF